MKGATSGARDFLEETLEETLLSVTGLKVVELGADAFGKIATDYGIDIAANALEMVEVGAGLLADVAAFSSPLGILISGAVKGYRSYCKAKEEDSVLIFTFKKPGDDGSSYIGLPFPALSPENE